jgi:ADP-Ribosyltransferase in polyvalent proteins
MGGTVLSRLEEILREAGHHVSETGSTLWNGSWGKAIREDMATQKAQLERIVRNQVDPMLSRDPNALIDFAAGNNPMMGLLGTLAKAKPTVHSQAHETARQNAVKMLGLPETNTAMDRARAMGFDVETPVYHGTNADFDAFDLNRSGSASGAEQYGAGVYTTTDPHTASGYANVNTDEGANVMPLLVNMKKPLDAATNKELTRAQVSSLIKQSPNLDDALSNYGDIGYEGRNKVLNEAVKSHHEWQDDNLLNNLHPIANDFYKGNNQAFNDAVAKTLKKDGVIVNQYSGEKFLIPFNPKQVRSRFAAFDPAKKDSANILANLLYGIPAAGYMLNQDKERKK